MKCSLKFTSTQRRSQPLATSCSVSWRARSSRSIHSRLFKDDTTAEFNPIATPFNWSMDMPGARTSDSKTPDLLPQPVRLKPLIASSIIATSGYLRSVRISFHNNNLFPFMMSLKCSGMRSFSALFNHFLRKFARNSSRAFVRSLTMKLMALSSSGLTLLGRFFGCPTSKAAWRKTSGVRGIPICKTSKK